MKKCLVTGASGQLGREIVRSLSGGWDVVGLSHQDASCRKVDLRDQDALKALLTELRPDVVVHSAAYRDPDFCETNPDEVARLNVEPVRMMCEGLPPAAKLVFISSDYVFDGDHAPYAETDVTCPVNVYGQSKVDGEALALGRENTLVLRIPLLIGASPTLDQSGFIAQARAAVLCGEAQELDAVAPRFPTWTRDVAEALRFLLERNAMGVTHYSSLREGTRYTWTREIAEVMGVAAGHITPSPGVVPRGARRPANSQLDTALIQKMGFGRFTDFKDVVRQVLTELDVTVAPR